MGEATTTVVLIVFVLSMLAIGQERDYRAREDDRCQRLYQKQYSTQHRTCVRPQR